MTLRTLDMEEANNHVSLTTLTLPFCEAAQLDEQRCHVERERAMTNQLKLLHPFQPTHQIWKWRSHLGRFSPCRCDMEKNWETLLTAEITASDIWSQINCPNYLHPFKPSSHHGHRWIVPTELYHIRDPQNPEHDKCLTSLRFSVIFSSESGNQNTALAEQCLKIQWRTKWAGIHKYLNYATQLQHKNKRFLDLQMITYFCWFVSCLIVFILFMYA